MKKLSEKQQIVEDYLLQGLSCKEIAFILGLKFETISSRKTEIYKKRGVHSIGELLALRFKDILHENKVLKKQVETLEIYKKRWECLRDRAYAERK